MRSWSGPCQRAQLVHSLPNNVLTSGIHHDIFLWMGVQQILVELCSALLKACLGRGFTEVGYVTRRTRCHRHPFNLNKPLIQFDGSDLCAPVALNSGDSTRTTQRGVQAERLTP